MVCFILPLLVLYESKNDCTGFFNFNSKIGNFSQKKENRGIWPMSIIRFTPYPFQVGQKIHISEGPRKGDWEVISVDEKKVGLRCPVTGFEAHWARFCYFVEEKDTPWPVSTEKDDK